MTIKIMGIKTSMYSPCQCINPSPRYTSLCRGVTGIKPPIPLLSPTLSRFVEKRLRLNTHNPQHQTRHFDKHIEHQRQRSTRHKDLQELPRLDGSDLRLDPPSASKLFASVDIRRASLIRREPLILHEILQEVVLLAVPRKEPV